MGTYPLAVDCLEGFTMMALIGLETMQLKANEPADTMKRTVSLKTTHKIQQKILKQIK
ncbi:hypothetical protein GCM10009100_01630 [Thalassospira tepidiphila]